MKNKKGFTLVELLGVIIILGVLVIIVSPKLKDISNNKSKILYDNTVNEINRLASIYLVDNQDLYTDIRNNGYVDITVDDLCDNKMISCPIIDPRDSSEINGYVRVEYQSNKYVYEFIRE